MKRNDWYDLGAKQMLVRERENWASVIALGELALGRKVGERW